MVKIKLKTTYSGKFLIPEGIQIIIGMKNTKSSALIFWCQLLVLRLTPQHPLSLQWDLESEIFQGGARTITYSITWSSLGTWVLLHWRPAMGFLLLLHVHFTSSEMDLLFFLISFFGELTSRIQFENMNLLIAGNKQQFVWPQHVLFGWIWSSLCSQWSWWDDLQNLSLPHSSHQGGQC